MKKTIILPEYKYLCVLLVEARQKAGLLQAQLAKKLRKPQSFISKVETAERVLDLFEYLTYARTLGLEPYELLKTVEQTKPPRKTKKSSVKKKVTDK